MIRLSYILITTHPEQDASLLIIEANKQPSSVTDYHNLGVKYNNHRS
jgi:hypothetical protein